MKEKTCKKSTVTLKYQGKEYTFDYDWNEDYPTDSANFMFEEGNYSCDCNKKIFLNQYCGLKIDNEDCGDKIELVSIEHLS